MTIHHSGQIQYNVAVWYPTQYVYVLYVYVLLYVILLCLLEFVGFTIDSPPAVDFSTAIPGTDGGRVTLSETAVKPIHADINALPKCDISQVDMESLFVIIRNYVLVKRLRVKYYFI